MLKFVVGPSGSGKTNWLIEEANKDKKNGNGNIAFVDTDDEHIFSLDHGVRLINAAEYGISNLEKLYGFIFGMVSRDYDLEKIYIDGIYSIIELDSKELCKFKDEVDSFSKKHNLDVFMGINIPVDQLCSHAQDDCIELKEK